jgi:hypothetical protein
MKTLLAVLLSIALPTFLLAQNATIKGTVRDLAANKPLAFATISLVKASDSTLITFARADSSGLFQIKSIPKGEYLLSASYVGYYPTWTTLNVKEGDEIINTGNIIVKDLKSLGDVTVTAKRPPVTVTNDTLEFNAENFRTQPNAVVEELLKKMPGVTVDNDGVVRVNGQRITRVMVNGKEFFTGDPKMATRNLPADAIDKVQVFDKRSDRAEFTGIDDGTSEKAINLKLKKDRNNALFGKITSAAGTDNRYDGQFNINKFKGEQQVSFIGMGNNTNRQGFSFSDALSFSGDMMRNMRGRGGMVIRMAGGDDSGNGLPVAGAGNSQQGIAKTYAGGLNYNDKWGKKTDVNTSYIINDQTINTNRETNRQNIVPGNNFNYVQQSNSTKEDLQHRVNLSIDRKIDSFNSIKISSAATFQKSKSNTFSNYMSESSNRKRLNSGFTNSVNDAGGMNVRNNLLYRKRFAKPGRTISANLNLNYNESVGDAQIASDVITYEGGGSVRLNKSINQNIGQDAINRGYGGNVTYTEPTWKGGLAELSYFYNVNVGQSEKQTFDFNNVSGKHDLYNDTFSNNFKSNYSYTGGSLNFRTQRIKWTTGFGASLQKATLNSILNKSINIKQGFNDVLPNASLTYKINTYRTLRLEYTTNTRQPSVTQLQPVPDISDPLNIREGNPNLKREYNNNINFNYFSADPATRKNFVMFASFNTTSNAIVSADFIDPATGIRTIRPVNANDVYSAFAAINTGFPLRKLKSRIDLGTSLNRFQNTSYINNNRNNISNLSISPNLSWNYGIENRIDIVATARIGYNKARYSLQKQLNTNYWQQQYSIDVTNYLPLGVVINNSFNYTKTTGRVPGYNVSIPFWNASLAKGFLKNKRAELKISGFDLLNGNIGVTRNANQNYIEDIRYNVLKRYFLLSFTYSLNKSGLNTGPRAVIRTF